MFARISYLVIFCLLLSAQPVIAHSIVAEDNTTLKRAAGLFRFSFDNLSMPQGDQNMGLLGVNYLVDVSPHFYAGVGGFGSVTGTQGGMFIMGLDAGYRTEIAPNWFVDVGLFGGGGGGKSSLVGGGLMWRPSFGIAYAFNWARLGLHYSYIDFPTGQIHSQQIGFDIDIPMDFYYLEPQDHSLLPLNLSSYRLPCAKFLDFERNDFAILLQAYYQHQGIHNTNGVVQDGTVSLVGFEFDHYFYDDVFWWLKASGAFHGIPHGYMDVLGGIGYHWDMGLYGVALVPQFGLGAGGGGQVDTGGGFLVNPLLGIEVPITKHFSGRVSSGYLWAPKGEFQAVPLTGEVIYHLNIASGSDIDTKPMLNEIDILSWRVNIFNQSYFHPQRISYTTQAPINLLALQIDQIFTNIFFMSYQAAFAYEGAHAGGYATGMIGPGLQTRPYLNNRLQLFTELLVGAGGGGNLAMGGGALVEPVVGVRYNFDRVLGVQASLSQIKSISDELSTPALNIGVTINFDTLSGF